MTTMTTPSTPQASGRLRDVDPATLADWLRQGQATLVDVREPDEHAREHIEGATLAPLSRLDPLELRPESGRRLVLHCRSGGRSTHAGQRLLASGAGRGTEVWQLAGGIEAWKTAGLPTVVNRRAPLPIMRQVQITAGSLVLLGVVLAMIASPWFLALSAFVGGGLVFAGVSGWCGMATLLQRMPWNRQSA